MSDDHIYQAINANSNKLIPTHNIDRLLGRGYFFKIILLLIQSVVQAGPLFLQENISILISLQWKFCQKKQMKFQAY